MATGIWTPQGCKPVAVAAAMDCNTWGAEWGNTTTAYSSTCIATTVGGSNTYSLTIQRCTNATCTNIGSVQRAGQYCDTDWTTGPFNISMPDAIQLGWALAGVLVAAALVNWLHRVIDGSVERA